MDIDSLSISLIVDPVSLVDIAIDMSEFTLAMRPIVLPVTFIASAVLPGLLSVAVTEPTDPLPCVLCTSRVRVGGSLLTLSIWVIRHV